MFKASVRIDIILFVALAIVSLLILARSLVDDAYEKESVFYANLKGVKLSERVFKNRGANELACIKSYSDEYSAELDRAVLENHGISAVINKHFVEGLQRTPGGGSSNWFEIRTGGVRLSVRPADVSRAKSILESR